MPALSTEMLKYLGLYGDYPQWTAQAMSVDVYTVHNSNGPMYK